MNRYILGSEQMFHDFVNSLSKEDKIGVVTHVDLDGIASGIFLQKILESRDLKIDFMEFLDYNADSLKPIFKKDIDVLFFTDWNVDNYPEDLMNLRKKYNILIVDHHPPNKDLIDKSNIIKTDSKYCSTHALFDLAKNGNYFDTKNFEWLVCSAIIMDYTVDNEENIKILKSFYPEITLENIWKSKPALIGKSIADSILYYKPHLKVVYETILNGKFEKLEKAGKIITKEINEWKDKFRREAEHFPEEKLYFYYGNPKHGITSAVVSEISNSELSEDTLIFISNNIEKGKEDFVKLSARNQTGKVDLSKLLKKCTEDFEECSVGGHIRAAAGSFPKRYLDKFKERLLLEIK
jgi:single-stranded DNA-specific DHH superfamily exonuclease